MAIIERRIKINPPIKATMRISSQGTVVEDSSDRQRKRQNKIKIKCSYHVRPYKDLQTKLFFFNKVKKIYILMVYI